MKRILTLVLISFMSTFSYAQCEYEKNEVDDFTGDSKKILKPEMFVAYTDSSLLSYYKRKDYDYFEWQSYCGKINDSYAVYFYITIRTDNAYKYYGVLREDAEVILKFESGETLTLNIASSDYGDANYEYDYTTYSTFCMLSESDRKTLRTESISKIRMYWSKGYEDYDCDSPDLFKTQLECLK